MHEPRALIESGARARVRKSELYNALGVSRFALWMYEQNPETAPEGFWERYRAALVQIGRQRVEGLAADLGITPEELLHPQAQSVAA